MQKKDRRKSIRLIVYHLVKYKPLSGIGEQAIPVLATLKDIGAGGICLRTQESLPISGLIELKINFPNLATSLFTLAKVIWVKQKKKSGYYEIGAQFVEMEESLSKIIDERVKLVYKRLKEKKRGLFKIFFKKGGVR